MQAASAAAMHPCRLGLVVRTYNRIYLFRASGTDYTSAFHAQPESIGKRVCTRGAARPSPELNKLLPSAAKVMPSLCGSSGIGLSGQHCVCGQTLLRGALSSEDAEHWGEIADDARVPDAYALGWSLKRSASELSAWQDGSDQLLHTTVVDDNPEQLDCRSRRCLALPNALLLVP